MKPILTVVTICLQLTGYVLVLIAWMKAKKYQQNEIHDQEKPTKKGRKTESKKCIECKTQQGIAIAIQEADVKQNRIFITTAYVCKGCINEYLKNQTRNTFFVLTVWMVLLPVSYLINATFFIIICCIALLTFFTNVIPMSQLISDEKKLAKTAATQYRNNIMLTEEKHEDQESLAECSVCNKNQGYSATFYFGKKKILKEYSRPHMTDSTKVVHVTEYVINDIQREDKYICERCIRKLKQNSAIGIFAAALIIAIISTILIITDKHQDKQSVLGFLVGIPVFLCFIIWGFVEWFSKPKPYRHHAAIRYFSRPHKNRGYNKFLTPEEYKKYIDEISGIKPFDLNNLR